jgi:hypothetical protein
VVLADISTFTIGDVNPLSQEYIPPRGFAWADLYASIPLDLLSHTDATPPAPIQSWYWMIMNMGLYLVLAW